MRTTRFNATGLVVIILLLLFSCSKKQEIQKVSLVEVAQSSQRWTGVAVSREGRILVNYPRWSASVTMSVAEIDANGQVKPFPDAEWNRWNPAVTPQDHFICVQSVYVDRDNYLWILDPANALFQGVVIDGVKLVKVDLSTNKIIQRIYFDSTVVARASYLNDIRVDTNLGYGYITDSGAGSLVVVDLATGTSRRVLVEHPSTKAQNITLNIEGIEWHAKVHADGLALDLNNEYLYYQALTGRSLYRIKTEWLREPVLSEFELGNKVEYLGESGASDAIAFGNDGNIYLTSLEYNAIRRFTPERRVEMVVQDSRLRWPDSFSLGADGTIFVTTAQIHLGDAVTEPYRIFKLDFGK